MKILTRIILIIFVLLVVVYAASWFYLKHQSPQYSGEIKLDGLEKQVEIVYDAYGIPHIYAQNGNDAYYALGYAQAQERLFQMVLYRRLLQGRASEIFGSALISTDKYFHTLGLNELAKAAAKKHFKSGEGGKYQEPAKAYIQGINAFIKKDNLPLEFSLIGFKPELFKVEDIYGSINLTALGFSFAQREDLILNYIYHELGAEYMPDWSTDFSPQSDSTEAPVSLLMGEKLDEAMSSIGLPLWEGSNGYVVGPSKTKSGKAILANDTHIGFSQPAVWYEAYINYPGYEFYGSFLPTCPYGVVGHNRSQGWGLTIFPFDNMDYYQVESDGDPNSYLLFGDTLQYQKEEVEIKVKDAEPVTFTRKATELGPIINGIDTFVDSLYQSDVALVWSIYQLPQTSLKALYLMNHAHDIASFQQALPLIDIVGLNVMYADKDDNIAWWGCGHIPLRDSLSNSFLFLNSNQKTDQQFGFQSFDKNPHLVNPPSAFIATANNNPVYSGSHYERGNYLPTDRVFRIQRLLKAKNDWDAEAIKTIQLDVVSTVKADLAHFIVQHLINLPEDRKYQEAAKILQEWDGNYQLQAVAPTIFARMYFHIASLATADELGTILFDKACGTYLLKKALPKLIYNENSPWWKNKNKQKLSTRDQVLTEAFMTTVDELQRELGPQEQTWKWMKVHTLVHEHPVGKQKPMDQLYNVGPFPIAGGNQVVNKMEYNLSGDAIHHVKSGPALRVIIDWADVDAAENINPTGESGNFHSPHYDDQAQLYVNGIYRGMIMDKGLLMASKHETLLLEPK